MSFFFCKKKTKNREKSFKLCAKTQKHCNLVKNSKDWWQNPSSQLTQLVWEEAWSFTYMGGIYVIRLNSQGCLG